MIECYNGKCEHHDGVEPFCCRSVCIDEEIRIKEEYKIGEKVKTTLTVEISPVSTPADEMEYIKSGTVGEIVEIDGEGIRIDFPGIGKYYFQPDELVKEEG